MSATLFFKLSGDIPAGQVKIRVCGHVCAQQFCAGRRLKRLVMGVEEFNAFAWRWRYPQQGAERTTVHHAEARVLARLKCQRVKITPPDGWFAGWHLIDLRCGPVATAAACLLTGKAILDESRFCD